MLSCKINKGVKMGLDQYAGLRDSKGEVHIDFDNVYSGKYEPEKSGFVWRKHARLQVFMCKQFNKQKHENEDEHIHNTIDDLQHLGFNAGQGGVKITEELIKELEEQIKNNYWDCFASDGFFWGQQFQEEAVKEYKSFDKKFIKWAKEQLKAGRQIGYDCSW
jgi:hypothetical protein